MNKAGKIISGAVAVGVVGAGAFGLSETCLFDAEKLQLAGEEVCFSTEQEYIDFKDKKIEEARSNGDLYLWTQGGQEFLDIVNHEMQKGGIKETSGIKSSEELVEQLINIIQ